MLCPWFLEHQLTATRLALIKADFINFPSYFYSSTLVIGTKYKVFPVSSNQLKQIAFAQPIP